MNTKNLLVLPDNLPVPEDDGACAHLEGMKLPSIPLASTSGRKVDLSLEGGMVVVYLYPMIGRPDSPPMVGWNEIPGARGCTPQSLEDQKEAVRRLHLPFELLSDSKFELVNSLRLPTFEYNSLRLVKRLTLVVENGVICKVFYPVFPPNENADNVIAWLRKDRA